MATFEVQVEALTGITISSSSTYPTQAQLTQFLIDGVIDVTNRWLAVKPQEREDFQRESTTVASNGGFETKGAQIISVIREAEADGSSDGSTAWRACRKVPASMQSRVVDTDSLYFASKYNPVYTIIDYNKVHVYPVPDGTNDGFKVFYINNVPTDQTNGASLAYSHSDIKYFPNDKVYLVAIYAAIKSLENALSAKNIPTISGDSTSTPIELTDISALDTPDTIDVAADAKEVDQWWTTAGHLIEDEEDAELASLQLQKIGAYLSAYQAQLQGNTTDYQWMQGIHQILSRQYDSAFAIAAPRPAQ